MKYMPNWVIESWELSGEAHLGDVGVVIDGEFASVAGLHCVLTDSDHKTLRRLDRKHSKETTAYFRTYRRRLFGSRHDKGSVVWKALCERQIEERNAPYAKGEPYIDGHRYLICGAPYAYELLCKYRDTGTIDGEELARVLGIMEGVAAPVVPRVEDRRSLEQRLADEDD